MINVIKSRTYLFVVLGLMATLTISNSIANYQQQQVYQQQQQLIANNLELLEDKLRIFNRECFVATFDPTTDKKCIVILGKVSRLLDSTPTNTAKQAELWELGRLYLSSLWLSSYNPELSDRLAFQLATFYNYPLDENMLAGKTKNGDVKFRSFLKQQYQQKLKQLDN